MATKNQHPGDVKAKVRKKCGSLAELARRNDLSPSTIRKALYRPQPSGNKAIAKLLGKTPHKLWPKWFDEEGNRIPSAEQKDSSADQAGHGQKSEAA